MEMDYVIKESERDELAVCGDRVKSIAFFLQVNDSAEIVDMLGDDNGFFSTLGEILNFAGSRICQIRDNIDDRFKALVKAEQEDLDAKRRISDAAKRQAAIDRGATP